MLNPRISGRDLIKAAVDVTVEAQRLINGDGQFLRNGLPSKQFVESMLVAKKGFEPSAASTFAEFVVTIVPQLLDGTK